ncbi:NUDIX domain-containing protein [Nemania sp. NC0429]|nr:NUDIX domain-containing protein [Nemania sp. NC0429]
MAEFWWKSTLYPSDLFVEACGAVVFDTSAHPRKVCLLYHGGSGEWLLPKGRRNCNETRQDAVRREVREESGYGISLRPLTLTTRAPPDREPANAADVPRVCDDAVEPFMLDVRELGLDKGVKLVWWFVAEHDGTEGEGEAQFKAVFVRYERAIERLTFRKDREVLARAIELVEQQQQRQQLGNGAEAKMRD